MRQYLAVTLLHIAACFGTADFDVLTSHLILLAETSTTDCKVLVPLDSLDMPECC